MGFFSGFSKLLGGISKSPLLGALGKIAPIFSAISMAQSLFKGSPKSPHQGPVEAAQAPPFSPQRPGAMDMPEGLGAEFSGFSPQQQRSALATKGLNGGLGSEEDSYYRNLVQRSLIGDNNEITAQDPNQFLLPVESQYFSRKGFNTSDPMQFLQGISR